MIHHWSRKNVGFIKNLGFIKKLWLTRLKLMITFLSEYILYFLLLSKHLTLSN